MINRRFAGLLFPLFMFGLLSQHATADTVVLSDDGREVKLNDDGSWEFVSEDRFATTEDGERIRLRADGRWEPVNDDEGWIALPREALNLSRDSISEENLKVELDAVTIEAARSARHKNTRVNAQMIFHLEAAGITASQPLTLAADQFRVRDSRGREYPIKQVSPGRLSAGDGRVNFIVVADGSPRWWGIKFLELHIGEGVLGNADRLKLTKSRSAVTESEVAELTEFP